MTNKISSSIFGASSSITEEIVSIYKKNNIKTFLFSRSDLNYFSGDCECIRLDSYHESVIFKELCKISEEDFPESLVILCGSGKMEQKLSYSEEQWHHKCQMQK